MNLSTGGREDECSSLFLRLPTSVPVFSSFIEVEDCTLLQLGLMTKPFENGAKIITDLGQPMRLGSFKPQLTMRKSTNRISAFQPRSQNHHHHSVTASIQKIRRYSSPVVTIFSSSYALLKVQLCPFHDVLHPRFMGTSPWSFRTYYSLQ